MLLHLFVFLIKQASSGLKTLLSFSFGHSSYCFQSTENVSFIMKKTPNKNESSTIKTKCGLRL